MAPRNQLGDFERVVMLAVSRLKEEAYGTTVIEEVEIIQGREASVGATYTTLQRLEQKGLISSERGDPTPQRGGRAKRFFSLTLAGETALRDSLEGLKRFSNSYASVQEPA